MCDLRLVIMLVGLGADLDFLDLDRGRALSGFLLLLLGFVLELSEIHDATNRGLRVGSDLDEVQTLFLSDGQGFARGQNAKLRAVLGDHPASRARIWWLNRD